MVRKPFQLPKMSSNEIKELIESEKICRIAFHGKDFPYVAPFQYIKIDDSIYVHFTKYGKKIRLIEKNNSVCVTVEKLNEDMSDFKFVTLQGKLSKVENEEERINAIHRFSVIGRESLSTTFLTAHGFSPEDGWDSLSIENNLMIFKLGDISRIIGLRSP